MEPAAAPGKTLDFLVKDDLLKAYQGMKGNNRLVERSLLEASEAQQGFWWVDAPGNHALTFSTRIGDADLPGLCRVITGFPGAVQYLSRINLSYNQNGDEGAKTLATGLLAAGQQ